MTDPRRGDPGMHGRPDRSRQPYPVSRGRDPDAHRNGPRPPGRDRDADWPARGRLPSQRARPRFGSLPGGLGACLVIAGTLAGTLVTVLAGSPPGPVLGVFLVASTLAASLAVQAGAAYLIIPLPAPVYVVAAAIAGLAHGQAGGSSRTAMAISATQWIAAGFLPMTAATALAVAITIGRRRRQGASGRSQARLSR